MKKSTILKVVGAITLTVAAIGGIAYAVHKFKEYFVNVDADFIDCIDDEEDAFDEKFFDED